MGATMFCKKKCPECNANLSFKKITQPLYKHDANSFNCSECDSEITPKWSKVGGYIGLFIILSPALAFSSELTALNIVYGILKLAFIIFPISFLLIYCLLPIKLSNNEKNT